MITSKIETDRLYIRHFKKDDWRSVFSYMSDPNIIKHLPEDIFSENDAKEFIVKNMGKDARNFALIRKEDKSLIGHMVFHKWFAPDTLEIGWIINA